MRGGETLESVEVPSGKTSRLQSFHNTKVEEELVFIISILKTNYFLQLGKTREGGVTYFFFSSVSPPLPLFFPLFFNRCKND